MSIEGSDAATFLQGQLTQDVLSMSEGDVRLSGYCSAKGRLLATGWLFRESEHRFVWWVSRDLAADLAKRLTMFVLRAKCKVADLGVDHLVLATWGPLSGDRPLPTGWVALPPVGATGRAVCLTEPNGSSLAPAARVVDIEAWDALEVASGVARIEARTKDAFVPQMINWDLVGGVSFSKGCYPGQEVVARSQYRGTVKRRLIRVSIPLASSVAIGEPIFDTADPDQPAGQIANAALDSGVWKALVEVKLAALIDGSAHEDARAAEHSAARLRLGSSQGLPMVLESLPYVISAPT